VHLFKRAPGHIGHDDQPVTLMSEASLTALAPEFSGIAPDPRRFRMTITMTGTDAWAEHGWGGQEVAIGEAILRVIGPVPRCVVTTRNPDSGATDARVLHALARLRGKNDVTFGVWCDIVGRTPACGYGLRRTARTRGRRVRSPGGGPARPSRR